MEDRREIRLWYAGTPRFPDLFDYKRGPLLDSLRSHGIEHSLILAQPEFLLLRISVDTQALISIQQAVETTLTTPFTHITVEAWSPSDDSRRRILSAKDKLPAASGLAEGDGDWQIIGNDSADRWVIRHADLETEVEIFARFMTRVVGEFTLSFLTEIPERIENRWLMSVLVHLMLNSISLDQGTEAEIRAFPYL